MTESVEQQTQQNAPEQNGKAQGVPASTARKNRKPPSFELATVTPELAAEWLEMNTHNRSIKWRRVKEFAGAIKRGEWVINGDAIRFDYNGVLLDGQNRLLAVISAKMPITTFVVFNLDPASQETMDQGSMRLFSDTLKLHGETNVNVLASATRWVFIWDRYTTSGGAVDTRIDRPTNVQLLEFFNSHKSQLHAAVAEAGKVYARFHAAGPRAIVATAWYIFSQIDSAACREFFTQWAEGAQLEIDDPIYALRRWMMNNQNRREKARGEVVLAIIVKAWNAYRAGERPELLSYTDKTFPKAK
jgi:hypothetical protein